MSRPLRIEFPGACYHVMNRGAGQRQIFKNQKDYETFLSTLEEGIRLFDGIMYAYCLMPNHYHILLRTPSGNLSRLMRHVNGVYTQRFNRQHRRDGPLFRGRFKGILVQEDSYLLEVVRYIHKNPMKAKMVERLNQFKWSSHKSYMSPEGSLSGLDRNFVLQYFSSNRRKAVELYRRFMEGREDEATEQFYSSKKQGSILGDLDFIELVKEKYILRNRSHDKEVREIRRICGEKVIKNIRKEVCRVFKVVDGDLSQGKRGTSNIARQTALSLSRELSGLKLSEICDYYGIGCRQTVGAHFARLQVRMKKDKAFEKKYNRLKLKCSQVAT